MDDGGEETLRFFIRLTYFMICLIETNWFIHRSPTSDERY